MMSFLVFESFLSVSENFSDFLIDLESFQAFYEEIVKREIDNKLNKPWILNA